MEKKNEIIKLFAGLDAEERKEVARDVQLAGLLLDQLDQFGELRLPTINQISRRNPTATTLLERLGFQLVKSVRATNKPGPKPMAWRQQNGHETV